MNGRTIGDLFGKYTSHQWNGSSVVDYFIAPNDFARKISHFIVGDYLPWISDHCPIHTTIRLESLCPEKRSEKNEKLKNVTPSFIWNEDAKTRYLEKLNSKETKDILEKIFHDNNINTLKLACEIKEVLLDTADKCKLNRKKSHEGSSSAVWFDSECEEKKQKLQKLSRKLKNSPHNAYIPELNFLIKKRVSTNW